MSNFHETLEELQSAEDFFDFFRVPYESGVLASQRLQIMQRLRCVLRELDATDIGDKVGGHADGPVDDAALAEVYRSALSRIYEECRDGTSPSARELRQKKVDDAPAATHFVPLTAIRGARRRDG